LLKPKARLLPVALAGFIFALVMSLGPFLKIFDKPTFLPLPYCLLMVLPGFNMLRSPARILLLGSFWWSTLVAISYLSVIPIIRKQFPARYKSTVSLIFAVATSLLFFAQSSGSVIPFRAADRLSPAYAWLNANTPKETVIAEIPIDSAWDSACYAAALMSHWRKTVNGYSSYCPRSYYPTIEEVLSSVPDRAAVADLSKLGVDYLFVHKSKVSQNTVNVCKRLPGSRDFDDILVAPLASLRANVSLAPAAEQLKLSLGSGTVKLPQNSKVSMVCETFSNRDWQNHVPNKPVTAVMQWQPVDHASRPFQSTCSIQIPLLLTANTPCGTDIVFSTPHTGAYSVSLILNGSVISADNRIEIVNNELLERGEPKIRVTLSTPPTALYADTKSRINLSVANIGTTVLSTSVRQRIAGSKLFDGKSTNLREIFNRVVIRTGTPSINCAWLDSTGKTIMSEEKSLYFANLYPGANADFATAIAVPKTTGHYRFVVSLVSGALRETDDSGKTRTGGTVLSKSNAEITVVALKSPPTNRAFK
jgi:hypothetical protein